MNTVRKPVLSIMAMLIVAAAVSIGTMGVAEAHPWRCNGNTPYHWAGSGNEISVTTEFKDLQFKRQAKKASKDLLSKMPFIKLPVVTSGAQMSIVDSNEGDKGWAGLAVVKPNSNCEIQHADVIFNTFYATAPTFTQGVFCQEIGHSFGLDHSDDGSCMGLGYFRNGTTTYSSHNVSDIKQTYNVAQAPSDERLAFAPSKAPIWISAAWGFSPDSLGEAADQADTIVAAKALSSQPGPPIVTEDGVNIPTTNTTLEVDTAYEGDALPGEQVTVNQIGGGGVFTTEDPAYRSGQEYLLMLAQDQGSTQHIVSPDARYAIRADNTLTPTMETSLSASVSGATLSAFATQAGISAIKAEKREFEAGDITRILIIVGIVIAALVALAIAARFVLGRR